MDIFRFRLKFNFLLANIEHPEKCSEHPFIAFYCIIANFAQYVILSFCVSVCRVLSPGVVRELTHVEHLRSYNGHVLFPVSRPRHNQADTWATAAGAAVTRIIIQCQ